MTPTPRCLGCDKTPEDLLEYREIADELGCSPTEAVRTEEGTYNPELDRFYCTACYIAAGCPLGVAGKETRP